MTDTQDSKPAHIAIVTPVFNEELSLPNYEKQVANILFANPAYTFSVLLIDDGSQDNSWKMICEMQARDNRFSGLRLSRNFGSHIALTAGIFHADGDAMATLPCDLQDPPEVILEFAKKWREGAQIVWGKRAERRDTFLRVMTSSLFNKLLRQYAMPPGSKFTTGSFFLIDKKVTDCFREFQESNRIVFALVAWTGFEQATVDYSRQKRSQGVSGWTYSKMFKTMTDAFVGFSVVPIRIIISAGFLAFSVALGTVIYLLISYTLKRPVAGWTSLMLALSFFFGFQFFILGVMGEYLHRIYFEVTRRPLYFVSDYVGKKTRNE